MKNNESLSNEQSDQANNRWIQVLGDHATNATGDGIFQTVEDFRKEKAEKAAREKDYDPEREAWEKAHPKRENEIEDFPRTALDYMREDLEELQYGPLESYEGKPHMEDLEITETDEDFTTEQPVKPVAPAVAPIKPTEPVKPIESVIPTESAEPIESTKPTVEPINPAEPTVAHTHLETQENSTKPSADDDHKSFESAHLKWPEETVEEKFDKAMEQAEKTLQHVDDIKEEQRKQEAERLEEDEIAEINRVIAEMAYSGDPKLVELMHQKEYESDEDHKERLVRMAKTEIKWRQLKKAIEDARKHMAADNEAMNRVRASLAKSRETANTPTPYKEQRIGNTILRVAPGYEDAFGPSVDPNGWKEPHIVDNDEDKNTLEKNPDQKKILKKDLGEILRAKIAEREAGSSPAPEQKTEQTTDQAPEKAPEQKIMQKDLKDILRAKIAEREASASAESGSDSDSNSELKNESLRRAKAVLAEHQRRIDHVDDSMKAENDKFLKDRSPSTRKKITKIFSAISKKFKEKSRKKEEQRRQEDLFYKYL